MLEATAFKLLNRAPVTFEIINASVVLPLPGGPYKIKLVRRSAKIVLRRSLPSPRIWPWPMNSLKLRGLILLARGALRSTAAGIGAWEELKRSINPILCLWVIRLQTID